MQEIIQNHSVNYEPTTNIQKMLLSLPYMGNENSWEPRYLQQLYNLVGEMIAIKTEINTDMKTKSTIPFSIGQTIGSNIHMLKNIFLPNKSLLLLDCSP